MDTSEIQIKRIVLNRMNRCSVCHRDFEPDDISVISRKPDMWMMLVECTDCHARNYVAAVLKDGDADEARLALRELHEQATGRSEDEQPIAELAEVAGSDAPTGDPISALDVLEMHEFLQGFDGDFLAHFARG